MKSGHSEKDIDNAFSNRFLKNRRETLKKKTNKKRNDKIKFITEYEPSLPDIYTIWQKNSHLLKNNEELKNIFKTMLRISNWYIEKEAKTSTNGYVAQILIH